MMLKIAVFAIIIASFNSLFVDSVPEFVKPCSWSDPKRKACLIDALNHIKYYLKAGIPEINFLPSDPFHVDILNVALTGGEDGYKIQLHDIWAIGGTNYTIEDLRVDNPFSVILRLPVFTLNSLFSSSGSLLILPAWDNQNFQCRFNDIRIVVKGTTSQVVKNGKTYLHLDKLGINFKPKTVHMAIQHSLSTNQILVEAANLFFKENEEELMKIISPKIESEFVRVYSEIINNLTSVVPLDVYILP